MANEKELSQLTKHTKIRLERINIKNFKAIDDLNIQFPQQDFFEDLDIFVIGSSNGVGKTSLLEACALTYLLLLFDIEYFKEMLHEYYRYTRSYSLFDSLIKAGESSFYITSNVIIDEKIYIIDIKYIKGGKLTVNNDYKKAISVINTKNRRSRQVNFEMIISSFSSINSEPIIIPPLLYFHSYRKIQEGSADIDTIMRGEAEDKDIFYRSGRRNLLQDSFSLFKRQIYFSLLMNKKVFKKDEIDFVIEYPHVIDQLNLLLKTYANAKIVEELDYLYGNRLGINIHNINDKNNFYSLDGLSSGQKEIISMMFLIWYNTYNKPSLVLIDEPELHLNQEWHLTFIRNLNKLAPNNQYIITTHSEKIIYSIEEKYKGILVNNTEKNNKIYGS